MVRFKIGYITHKCRIHYRLFASTFLGLTSTKQFTQKKNKALVYAHHNKIKKRIYFRCLWITRLNAGTLNNSSYNLFMHNMYKKRLIINRKICAQIAISNKKYFYIILNEITN
uniref:Large ribosomal subunit protein bL20c n=3 Tax=Gastrodia elata TaxID=91201 RepID=A0A6B9ISF3_9ASPA|nr:ribosomal protein L20 [Gastrodia elata]QGZ09164.1 ribosomal protein L20 [Gastrodia elata]QII91321.1 ribosomal protein L20 [Gastrodia elata]